MFLLIYEAKMPLEKEYVSPVRRMTTVLYHQQAEYWFEITALIKCLECVRMDDPGSEKDNKISQCVSTWATCHSGA